MLSIRRSSATGSPCRALCRSRVMSRTFLLIMRQEWGKGVIGETDDCVLLRCRGSGLIAATARSDASGVFRIADLPPGDYEVLAMMQKAWRQKNNAGSIARKTTFIAGRV